VKADPDAQLRLLDLQATDTALTQLAHRRRNLPEHAELEELEKRIRSASDDLARAQVEVDDLDRDIARVERDIEQVRARAERDRKLLEAGTAPPRELESLQHELETLQRRQSELEDSELELMERRETAQAELDAVQERLEKLREQREEVQRRRDAALAEIAKSEEYRKAERDALAAELPADLLALYDRIREQYGGIGAAQLRARRCEGCRLELAGGDLARVKAAPPDEVVRCEECRRILVRTKESGL